MFGSVTIVSAALLLIFHSFTLSYINDPNVTENDYREDLIQWGSIAFLVVFGIISLFTIYALTYSDDALFAAMFWGPKGSVRKVLYNTGKLLLLLVICGAMLFLNANNYIYITTGEEIANDLSVIFNASIVGLTSLVLIIGIVQRAMINPRSKEYSLKTDPVVQALSLVRD